jgi:lactoylglutathione lyase
VSDRPFRILGIQQIAVGARDRATLRRLWVDTLGLVPVGTFRSEAENVDEEIAVAGSGPLRVEVDLMQPIDAAQKPKVHDPALNHVGFWVDNLHAAFDWLTTQGVRFTPGGIRKGAAGHDVCFIHPKGDAQAPLGGEGVLIELVQAPAEVMEAFRAAAEGGPELF